MKPISLKCVFVLFAFSCLGHDVPVHRAITTSAVNSSKGFLLYLQDNNYTTNTLFLYPKGQVGPPGGVMASAKGIALAQIVNGSAREDDAQEDEGGSRSLNHFYDPTTKKGLDTAIGGRPSSEWATMFDDINWTPHWGGVNYYSWQNARVYQSNSIVSASPTFRNAQAGYMFRSVGQVMHLLEDTTQPQHVRDEQHLDKSPFTGKDTKYRSKFEDYGTHNLNTIKINGYLAHTNFDW